MNPFKCWVIVLCLGVVFGRLLVHHVAPSAPGTYEALAHVFCGFLFGLWLANRDCFFILALAGITVVEGIAFFLLP